MASDEDELRARLDELRHDLTVIADAITKLAAIVDDIYVNLDTRMREWE